MAMHSSSAAEYVEYDHYLIKKWNTMDLTKMTTSIIPNPNLGLLAQQRGSMASDFQHMANSSYLFLRQNLTCPRWSTRLISHVLGSLHEEILYENENLLMFQIIMASVDRSHKRLREHLMWREKHSRKSDFPLVKSMGAGRSIKTPQKIQEMKWTTDKKKKGCLRKITVSLSLSHIYSNANK
ncbi:hypothetical protein YC2023_036609 [Brassica napus]